MKRYIDHLANQIGKIIVVKTGDEFDEVTTYYMQTFDGWRRLEYRGPQKGIPMFALTGDVEKNLDLQKHTPMVGPLVAGEKIKTPVQVFAAADGSQFRTASGKSFYKKGDRIEFEGKLYGIEGISPDTVYVGKPTTGSSNMSSILKGIVDEGDVIQGPWKNPVTPIDRILITLTNAAQKKFKVDNLYNGNCGEYAFALAKFCNDHVMSGCTVMGITIAYDADTKAPPLAEAHGRDINHAWAIVDNEAWDGRGKATDEDFDHWQKQTWSDYEFNNKNEMNDAVGTWSTKGHVNYASLAALRESMDRTIDWEQFYEFFTTVDITLTEGKQKLYYVQSDGIRSPADSRVDEGDVIQGPWKNPVATQKTNAAKLASEFLSSEYAPNDLEDEDIEGVAEYIVEFLLKYHDELTDNMDIDDIDLLAKRISREAFIQSDLLDEALEENLNKWFKEKWVRFGPDGKIRGACARGSDSEGKPKCLPQKKAQNLGKKGRKYAASKKRREDPNPERTGKAKNVATKKKTNEEQLDELKCWSGYTRVQGVPAGAPGSCKKKTNEELGEKCPHCGGELVSEEMMNEKQDACYHKVKSRYKVWPSAYASGALVQCRKKGASNWGTGGKKDESSIMKGIVSEAASPAQQAAIAINMKKQGKKPKTAKFTESKRMKFYDVVQYIVDYIGPEPSESQILDAVEFQAKAEGIDPGKLFDAVCNRVGPFLPEDYTGEFAAEKTPAINPYGGQPDRQFRGAISEMPNTSGPIGTQPGGWRTYKATPAGEIEEDTAYAGGMGQGGDAGQSYRKFTPTMAGVIKKESSIMKGLRKEGR